MAEKQVDKFKKVRYNSLTTECAEDFNGHTANAFAAEVVVYRRAIDDGYELPPYFWRDEIECPDIYKKAFNDGCKCLGRLMKFYPEHFIINCCVYARKIELNNYGKLTNYLKYKWETWNRNVAKRVTMMIKSRKTTQLAIKEAEFFSKEVDEEEVRRGSIKRKVIL